MKLPGEYEPDCRCCVCVCVPEPLPAAGDDVVAVGGQLQGPMGPHRQRKGALLRILQTGAVNAFRTYLRST